MDCRYLSRDNLLAVRPVRFEGTREVKHTLAHAATVQCSHLLMQRRADCGLARTRQSQLKINTSFLLFVMLTVIISYTFLLYQANV